MKKLAVAAVAAAIVMSGAGIRYACAAEALGVGSVPAAIGTWDGQIGKQEQTGPYTDWRQQELPFGTQSPYYEPWRSYLDTWDASKLKEVEGVVFNVNGQEADATALVLAEAGIHSARVEIPWGYVSYDDESTFEPHKLEELGLIMSALRDHGIRPLILLNGNSGLPAPNRMWNVTLLQDAPQGAREIKLDKTDGIVPGYTGLSGVEYRTMFPVITEVDETTGIAKLSAPLPRPIKAGAVTLTKLKYQPIAGTEFEGGEENPAAQETIDGWMRYVQTVTTFAQETLGTVDKADAGFDIEVWNEYGFGSEFLDINNYYNPQLKFAERLTYRENGKRQDGAEILLPLTANYVKDPANGLPGVTVINGFSNERPWDNGYDVWQNQDGFSRHYYTRYAPDTSLITKDSLPKNPTYNALGQKDDYVPIHIAAFPEFWFYGYYTETVVRDLQPFPSPLDHHFRYANPNNGKQAELWMTETNFWRLPFAQELAKKMNVPLSDKNLASVMHQMQTKTMLRDYAFYSSKGVKTINLYAVKGGDAEFGLVPDEFFRELERSKGKLTDAARAQLGPELKAVSQMNAMFKSGEIIDNPRQIKVDKAVEPKPRLVLAGDGTAAHPNRYQVDDFAVVPFQLSEGTFSVGYYVVTRDLTHTWDSSKGLLDPARYDMQPETFEVTLSNINGTNAKVSAYDPITDTTTPLTVSAATDTTLTVNVEATDYPRFLNIEEKKAGPLIEDVKLEKTLEGAVLSFVPNRDGEAVITWGPYPARTDGTFTREVYEDKKFKTLQEKADVPFIQIDSSEAFAGSSARWSGTISPESSETYTFIVETNDRNTSTLWVGDRKVADGNGHLEAKVTLEKGKSYPVTLTFETSPDAPHGLALYWAADHQSKSIVPAKPNGANRVVKQVKAGEPVCLAMPTFQPNDGVKISLASGGLTAAYPQWDYDTKGVLFKNAADQSFRMQVNDDSSQLYDDADETTARSESISSQAVTVVEEKDGWYKILTWLGDKWIKPSSVSSIVCPEQ